MMLSTCIIELQLKLFDIHTIKRKQQLELLSFISDIYICHFWQICVGDGIELCLCQLVSE